MVAVPIVACAAALAGIRSHGPSALDVGLLVAFYALTMLGLTAGFHRLFTHRSFRAHPLVELALAVAGSMALEGPIVRWVAQHRRHHAHADRDGDPHSPVAGGGSRLAGLWHAHVGWMLGGPRTFARRFAPDLLEDALVRRLDALYLVWVAASLGLPAAIGALATGSAAGAGSALLWGGLVRIFCVHQASWAVNSIGHALGRRPFAARDHSTNNALLALFTLGEGWHNNHHAFPSSARHGLERWQLDPTAFVIAGLCRLGLAWDVKTPTPAALAAKTRRGP